MSKRKLNFGGEYTADIEKRNAALKKPVKIAAYILGVVGILIYGGGMSIALVNTDTAALMVLGTLVSAVGAGVMIANKYIYNAVVAKRIYNAQRGVPRETETGKPQPENVIEVRNLTKNYGHRRGVFDVNFCVKKGEVFGFLGPNGAGKSTTMRHLMGFSKPYKGRCCINGKDCWNNHAEIMKSVGYLPGEVALPEGVSGKGFLDMLRGMRKSENDRTQELLEVFKVNTRGSVKRLSIGEKRKLAVAAAFAHDPDVLLLDEPTSGLDPVMQETFTDFVRAEKAKGKTVLLSSHIFSEVEALCDRIAIIKDGKIVSVVNAEEVKHFKRKTFRITFAKDSGYNAFLKEKLDFRLTDGETRTVEVAAENEACGSLLKTLAKYDVEKLTEHKQTLEEYFMHFYKSERKFGGLDK